MSGEEADRKLTSFGSINYAEIEVSKLSEKYKIRGALQRHAVYDALRYVDKMSGLSGESSILRKFSKLLKQQQKELHQQQKEKENLVHDTLEKLLQYPDITRDCNKITHQTSSSSQIPVYGGNSTTTNIPKKSR